MSAAISRRDLLSRFLGRMSPAPQQRPPLEAGECQKGAETTGKVAVIQARFCIALTSFCSVCTERCPEPLAMSVDHGVPRVNPNACTGCGVCHEVCPAPRNAVLMIPARRTLNSHEL